MTDFQICVLLLIVIAFALTWLVGYKTFEVLAKRVNWCVQQIQKASDR